MMENGKRKNTGCQNSGISGPRLASNRTEASFSRSALLQLSLRLLLPRHTNLKSGIKAAMVIIWLWTEMWYTRAKLYHIYKA